MNKYGDNRSHAYNSYPSSIDWAEKIIESEPKKRLIKAIISLLEEEYDFKSAENKKLARYKALELLEGENTFEKENMPEDAKRKIQKIEPVVNKPQINRKTILKKIIKRAEEKGFLEYFRLSEPWHHKPFIQKDFISYPYHHKTTILYRGVSRKPFKKEAHKSDSSYNDQSILEEGHLDTVTGTGEGYVWTFPYFQEDGAGPMNWTGSDGAVLEIQVPTEWIELGIGIQNLKEMQQRFESPENFREWLIDNKGKQKKVAFKIAHRVPIHYITGVHDMKVCDSGEFIPLKSENQRDYIDIINAMARDEVPENPSLGKGYKDGELYQKANHQARNSDQRIELMKLIDKILEKYYSIETDFQRPHPEGLSRGLYPAMTEALSQLTHDSEYIIREKNSETEKGIIRKFLPSRRNEDILNRVDDINEYIEFCYKSHSNLRRNNLSKKNIESDEQLISTLQNHKESIENNVGYNCNKIKDKIEKRREKLREIKVHVAKDKNLNNNIRRDIEKLKQFESKNLERAINSLYTIELD